MIRYLEVKELNNKLSQPFEFNEDLNIFTGPNGSGKTTLLKLIWHLISVGILEVNLRPAGGRDKLLQIYKRRSEFSQVLVAFIADQDMWLFSGIEPGYKDVIWTSGYSIENDLYSDANLESLLDENETAEHQLILDSISTWFAFAVPI